MTEVAELVAASNKGDEKEKCPFCPNKDLSKCKAKKAEPNDEVISNPSGLQTGSLTPKGEYPYTTAQHHLISAKQCYKKLKRLVRMGSMAEYDINGKPNGIALPTVANNLRFSVDGKSPRKYGKLSAAEKRTVSFAVMTSEQAQWHVGHHAVKVEMPDHWADEEEDTPWRRGHVVQYDSEVTVQLLKILSKYKPQAKCDEEKPDNLKSDMDELSGKIKGKLNEFKTDKPSGSKPYFVSQLAAEFAKHKDPPVKPPKPPRAAKRR